jgi:hypothetical protein
VRAGDLNEPAAQLIGQLRDDFLGRAHLA